MRWIRRRSTPEPSKHDAPMAPDREFELVLADLQHIIVPIGDHPPHAERLILHAPGACRRCDELTEVQHDRIGARVRFSGMTLPTSWVPCPSELFTNQTWSGNQPVR